MHFQELSDLCEKVRANVDAIHVCKCYYMSHAYREVRFSPAAIRGYSSAAIRHISSMSPCVPDHALASCSKTRWCACLISLAFGLLTGIRALGWHPISALAQPSSYCQIGACQQNLPAPLVIVIISGPVQ